MLGTAAHRRRKSSDVLKHFNSSSQHTVVRVKHAGHLLRRVPCMRPVHAGQRCRGVQRRYVNVSPSQPFLPVCVAPTHYLAPNVHRHRRCRTRRAGSHSAHLQALGDVAVRARGVAAQVPLEQHPVRLVVFHSRHKESAQQARAGAPSALLAHASAHEHWQASARRKRLLFSSL